MKIFNVKLQTVYQVLSIVTLLSITSLSFAYIKADTASFATSSEDTTDFLGIPPFLERATGKPSVVLAFDISGSMLVPAYPQNGVSWSNGTHTNFSPSQDYYGYFESGKQYEYDFVNGVFIENAALVAGTDGAWDGNFLNWLTMRRVDVARKVMVGGKVRDRDGESINGATKYVLEAEVEIRNGDDYTKQYSASSNYSDVPDGVDIEIDEGKIKFNGSGTATNTAKISDDFEVGYVNIPAWTLAQQADTTLWPTVTFQNHYTNPVVVVTALTYNGANSTVARAANVTSTDFKLGMQEWDSWDGNHTGEDFFYMVAEAGHHKLNVTQLDGSPKTISFVAGVVNTQKNLHSSEDPDSVNNYVAELFPSGAFSATTTPAVFTGVSTLNDTTPNYVVSSRPYNITNTFFRVTLQEEDTADTSDVHNASEEVHYIAIEPVSGATSNGTIIDVDSLSGVTQNETTVTYNAPFNKRPILNFASQTMNGKNAFSVRVEDDWDEEEAGIMLKRSLNQNDTTTGETVAFMAVSSASVYNIHLAVDEEPQGLVQENDSSVNFGLSVYNFDKKTNNIRNIVDGNKVHGGTMHPCYPIYDDDRWDRRVAEAASDPDSYIITQTLYSGNAREYLCVPTGIHAPNDKIVQVIEEYPLIWGSTPIAESLVDIGRYVKQQNPQYQDTSTDSDDDREVGNDPGGVFGVDGGNFDLGYRWDPYYDVVQEQTLDCKKVFVLHFNDGAPYRDYDGSGHSTAAADLYDIDNDSHTENEALDNVALALRHNDCRSDSNLPSHQEVISYFVYAALGADEQSNTSTRRMREAAARGGFVDENGDNLPDPMHPEDASGSRINFNQYKELNPSGVPDTALCPRNEWDANSDCEPDTFFLALDGAEIQDKLQKALNDILARVSSGGAASVVSTTSSGDGALYQASFSPSVSESGETVKWVGDVSGLMIDTQGLVRSDDGDGILEEFSSDPIYDSCYDETKKQVRVKLSSTEAERPNSADAVTCSASKYALGLDDVGYIWSAKEKLAELTDSEALNQRSTYNSSAKNRYIRTSLFTDDDGDGVYEFEEKDFVPSIFDSDNMGLLNTNTTSDAEAVVNFIRGVDQSGMRSRQLNGQTLRLGDVIYSTPVAVGRPSENVHILYDDDSYYDYFLKYRSRRTIVYVGGNDGMLHGFNAGWFDKANREFTNSKTGYTEWDLGQETWAYVPFNLLPHLKHLTNTDYGTKDGDHMYFVDQTPYVLDAKIFGSDGVDGQPDVGGEETHPHGWGTLMIVGFRFGGGISEVYPDPTDSSESITMRPAYLIFDITDPEQAPKLLAEFTHEKLQSTLSIPGALTVKNTSGGTDWYMAIGSGPSANANGKAQGLSEQNAHLFMLNLKTMSLESGFGVNGVMDLGEADSFVGDIVAFDHNLDVHTDAVYFGTSKAIDTQDIFGAPGADGLVDDWEGKLFRLRVDAGTAAGSHSWKTNVVIDLESPLMNRPQVSTDKNNNRWVHVGTGRFLTVDDTIDNDAYVLVGIKEPRQDNGSFDMDTYSHNDAGISLNDLVDVTDSEVLEKTGALNGSVTVSPALSSDNVESLAFRMMQYSDSSKYVDGWKRTLDSGERAMGSATILGGVLTQTVYTPELTSCSFIGDSSIFALRYTTGTAWLTHVFPDPNEDSDNDVVIDKLNIGVTPSLSPGVHLGESRSTGEATFINLNSDMSMTISKEQNLEGISSKETSWREL